MKISERYNGFLILEEPVLGGSIWYAVPEVYKENTKVLVSIALTPLKYEITKLQEPIKKWPCGSCAFMDYCADQDNCNAWKEYHKQRRPIEGGQ